MLLLCLQQADGGPETGNDVMCRWALYALYKYVSHTASLVAELFGVHHVFTVLGTTNVHQCMSVSGTFQLEIWKILDPKSHDSAKTLCMERDTSHWIEQKAFNIVRTVWTLHLCCNFYFSMPCLVLCSAFLLLVAYKEHV